MPYLRWLHTQGYPKNTEQDWIYDGWLSGVKELYASRAPGNSCLSALSSGNRGSIEKPINNSKGCGGVMRVAPVGLFCRKELAFQTACECAALTHGHPSGYLSAGVLAHIIACIIAGMDIAEAVNDALQVLDGYAGKEECETVIRKALDLANSDLEPIAAIKLLGEGWVWEEAIAISIYCALKYRDDSRKALCIAVNHDGDSDSTGAITGNILGAYHGAKGIPEVSKLAGCKEIKLGDLGIRIVFRVTNETVQILRVVWILTIEKRNKEIAFKVADNRFQRIKNFPKEQFVIPERPVESYPQAAMKLAETALF